MKKFNNKLNKLFLFSSLLAYASLGNLAVKADGPNLNSTAASCGSVDLATTGGNLGRNTQTNNYISDGILLGQCIDDLSTNQGIIDAWGNSVVISGEAINNTAIGSGGASTGAFTTLSASGTSTLTTVDINGGAIDGTAIGVSSTSTGAFTTLSASGTSTLTTVDINGGAIDGTAIGISSTSTGAFTTLTASGNTTFTSGTDSLSSTSGALVVTYT